jgi:putative copper resistance protein D
VLTLAAGTSKLPEFGWGTVFTQATADVAPLLAILLAGGCYVLGVRQLAARGHAWPVGRTISFVAGGLGTIAVATLSGLAAYDEDLFGAHMVQHMLLTMVAPVFLALGAPVTLALRTLPARGRTWLMALLHSRAVRVITFPAIPWVLFVGTPFALYFSDWYLASLRSAYLHEALHVHFLLVGCLFFWPLVGIDPIPGRAPYPFRMLMLFATLPFHAFLGVAIMSVKDNGDGLIAPSWYVPLRGLQGAVFQQQVGGGALWASGDLVGLLFLAVTLTQWMKASEREARREDRRLDRLEAAGSAAQGP